MSGLNARSIATSAAGKLTGSERVGQIACAISLSMITLVFYLHPVADMGLEAIFVTFVGLTTVYCMRASELRYRMDIALLFIVPFVALILMSMLVNSASYSGDSAALNTVVEVLNTGLILWVGLAVCSLNTSKFEKLLATVAILICSFMTIALAVHWSERYGGRFIGNHLHPNWWGAIAYGAGCCSIFIRRRWVRLACYGSALAMMLSTSSRGSLLGFAAMLMFSTARNVRVQDLALGILGLGLVGFICLVTPIGSYIYTFIFSDVLLLDNVYRGSGSGFTGRYTGWLGAVDLIAENPVFGIGPGMLPALHNGYLVTLAEYGVMASLFFFAALLSSIFWSRDYRVSAVMVSYAAFMIFAPRTINMVLGSLIPSICMMAGLARLNWPAAGAKSQHSDAYWTPNRGNSPAPK